MTRLHHRATSPAAIASRRRTVSAAALLAALAWTAVPQPARSQGSLPDVGSAPAPSAGAELKRLPADHDGLLFRGEGESRSFAVFMTRQQADKIGEFRLALVNAVSVQPDRSSLRLVVNGRQLTVIPVRSPGRASQVAVRIPPGLLVPGFNAVSISTTLAHRVDCSVKATYELWASLDPSQTGFVLPAGGGAVARTVSDIGGEPLGPDGTTHIHVRLADHPDVETVERASRLLSRLVAEAHIVRPIVDVGPEAGSGPGLDVVLAGTGFGGDGSSDGRTPRQSGLNLSRDPATGRLVVWDRDEAGVEAPAADPGGDANALAILRRASGWTVRGAERISFDDLGLPDDAFAGRHYVRTIHLRLPNDFYPGSYDKAHVLLDGAYAGDLDEQSALVFRVNGALVSTLKLRSGAPGHLRHETVELPLQFFHPGTNEVAIEGTLTTPADLSCDPGGKAQSARLMIGGSSEVEFPYLAHLATMPQIAGALAVGPGKVRDMYVLHDTPDAVGGALTIAANLAANAVGDGASALRLHFSPPGVGDPPGIVLGGSDELPPLLRRAVDRLTRASGPEPAGGGEAAISRPAAARWRDAAEGFFRRRGFFFVSPDKDRQLPMGASTLLAASVRPDEQDVGVVGVDLPRFTSDGRQWLVFTARTPDVSEAGIERLVADGLWPRLNGEATALDVKDGSFSSVDAAKLSYVLPQTIRAADLRPIMGGLMSSNIALTATISIFLLTLLGLTTHGLLRTDRRRPK